MPRDRPRATDIAAAAAEGDVSGPESVSFAAFRDTRINAASTSTQPRKARRGAGLTPTPLFYARCPSWRYYLLRFT